MPESPTVAELLRMIVREEDCGEAIDKLAQAALELTHSRHALVAVLNEELGCLELRHGAGEQFHSLAKGETVPLDVQNEHGIVAYVAATGKMYETGNVHETERYRELFQTTNSEIAIPVFDRVNRVRAVLNVESDRLQAYSDHDRDVCGEIAEMMAVVMDRDDLFKREEALIEIGDSLDRALTEEALIDRVIQVASEVLRFQACSIFILDPKTDTFVLRGSTGLLKNQVGEISYKRGEGFTGWVCDRGEPIVLYEPEKDPRWRGKYVEFPKGQVAGFLAVPIFERGKSIGAIRVIRRTTDNPYLDNRFTTGDVRVLQAISMQLASGLENIRGMERVIRSERMIAWGELSAKSSHMIGNRVFAIKGDVNELKHLLGEEQPNFKDLKEIQESLFKNVVRIEEVLQDFRDFVTATQLNRLPRDINAVIRETAEEVFPRRSQVHLKLELDENLPEVALDDKKFRRAISELIENSLNYMDRGELTIRSTVTEGKGRRRRVRIDIEDTGPGVEEERKEFIFQPFFTSRAKGMGLGLSIVKGIIDAHGGEVYEAGEPGKGAKFVMLLPLVDRP
jgi:signal transduction histidine kinase